MAVTITHVSGVPGGSGPDGGASSSGPRAGRSGVPYLLLLPGLAWLGVFFVVPILTLFGTSLQTKVDGGGVGDYEQTFRFANYLDAFGAADVQFGRALLYAGAATVLALLIGYPLAYMIAFKAGQWRNVLLVLVVAPFFTSFLLRTVAWRQILAEDGPVTPTLKWLHILPADYAVTASALAVITGLTYNFLPFMTLPLYASIERIDTRLLEAGSDLYGRPLVVLRKVTLPLSMPGIVSGTLLTFIPAAGDYVNATLLGNRNTTMVGNVIESRFFRFVDYPTAAALSFLLMLAILLLVTVYIRRSGTEDLV
ncbi:MAG: spermidine/putrescine transport system permease protein [Actinomycetota bacterium]|nr:spermidine/putrescine transport system permease protein [Actinomycetota bacterium]